MTKVPKTAPHSDIDGVREDQRPIPDSAREAGQDSADLELARRESVGRPSYSDDKGGSERKER